ncbi:TonB-dependent receptor domain-containing protein [Methylobacillus sp. Pita2]|uniref:TonB-dependent receptor domain-containing protein n=1 Tax=Methylobacillus sp. Pita2 TaxID=3383245 RepID=UPI0038B42BC2
MSKRGRTFHEQPQFKKLSHALHRVYSHKSAVLLTAMVGIMPFQPHAAELDTTLPKSNESTGSFAPSNIDIPSQPLDAALKQLARTTGISVAFDSNLATGKTAPAVKGRMKADEALRLLLAGSGLESTIDKDNVVIKPAAEKSAIDFQQVDAVEVRAKRFYEIGPLPGLGLTKEEIPGNVQSITAKEIKESHSLSITDLMNRKLQSVTVNDYQGNPFQMDVQYRGFTAGPQIGTPQGLSVFFDGIRVNEPFGDVVNWDMIPMNALESFDVFPGSNPIFGLNTLGGALTMKTKDGFNHTGVSAEVLTGSFGRKYLQAEAGWNNGTVALFGAGNFFMEDGWRENSPSRVNQFFGKASYRGDQLDLNLSTLWVGTDLVGNGLIPNQMYQQDRNASFTSEDTTENRLTQFQLSSSYFVNENFTITGQIYRRNSNRKALGADAYTDGFPQTQQILRNLAPGEEASCQFLSTNSYGIPDYYVFALSDPYDPNSHPFLQDFYANSGNPGYDLEAALAQYAPDAFNGALSAEYAKAAREGFNYWKNTLDQALFQENNIPVPAQWGDPADYANWDFTYMTLGPLYDVFRSNILDIDNTGFEATQNYFYTTDGVKHVVLTRSPLNKDVCQGAQIDLVDPKYAGLNPDGHISGNPGVIEGTPVAVLTDNKIKQQIDGASLQFNWNFEKHKFMVGASIDVAKASYSNSQRFGLFDEDRKAYLSPEGIRDQYVAADSPISNNNFSGTSTTKSIYASETWSPIDTLHISSSARYNDTHVKNTVATRTAFTFYDLASYVSVPDYFNLCQGSIDNCPSTGYKRSDGSNLLKPAETEKFSFYSLNPSLGLTWDAKKDLNFYINWAQGTRTPSVVELGCAFDGRPSGNKTWGGDTNGNGIPDPEEMVDIPISIMQNRSCTLPTTLSGDPYLPQIKATTYDIGFRGTIGENLRWNIGAYQTDLKDDIYLVTIGAANSYFDTIGKTRRRGIEAGISGKWNKLSFGVNYALTDATFQDTFDMISDHNSSAVVNLANGLAGVNGEAFRSITVKPGDRMPGIPLHNLNASMSYEVTDKWRVGLSAVLHSESFIRGNENNKHQPGVTEYYANNTGDLIARQPFNNPGKVDGYAIFNFQTSYQINPEWTATLLVNNIFDKEYFTAGRLGRNPFSPSINGAIGPGGYNHNSDDWLSANFLAPGAPRAAWFSLRYEFSPSKR